MRTVVEFPDRRIVAREAAEWLIRLDADTPPSREEFQALGEWLHRSAAHREELESLATLWGRMNVLTELAVPLGNGSRAAARPSRGERVASWGWAGLLAVSIAAAMAFGWLLLARQPAADAALATNGLHATAVGQQSTVTLADGSQVILNTNSQIKVDYGESYRRVHLLQGEALFTVAKNAARPFRVYAGQGRIEALGTAFSVFIDGADIAVTVAEGRVSLAAANPSRAKTPQAPVGSASALEDASMEVLGTLDAGHAATIRTPPEVSDGATELQTVQTIAPEQLARRLAWREGALMFSGETLEEVVKEFGRYSTVSIEIPDEAVRNMRIGGRLPVGETEAMLAALQTNFHLRVTRLAHNRVVISAADD